MKRRHTFLGFALVPLSALPPKTSSMEMFNDDKVRTIPDPVKVLNYVRKDGFSYVISTHKHSPMSMSSSYPPESATE